MSLLYYYSSKSLFTEKLPGTYREVTEKHFLQIFTDKNYKHVTSNYQGQEKKIPPITNTSTNYQRSNKFPEIPMVLPNDSQAAEIRLPMITEFYRKKNYRHLPWMLILVILWNVTFTDSYRRLREI